MASAAAIKRLKSFAEGVVALASGEMPLVPNPVPGEWIGPDGKILPSVVKGVLRSLSIAVDQDSENLHPRQIADATKFWLKALGDMGEQNLSWGFKKLDAMARAAILGPKRLDGHNADFVRDVVAENLKPRGKNKIVCGEIDRARRLLADIVEARPEDRFVYVQSYFSGHEGINATLVTEGGNLIKSLQETVEGDPKKHKEKNLLITAARYSLWEFTEGKQIHKLSCRALCELAKLEINKKDGEVLALEMLAPILDKAGELNPLVLKSGETTYIVSRFGVARIQDDKIAFLRRHAKTGEVGPALIQLAKTSVRDPDTIESLENMMLGLAKAERGNVQDLPRVDVVKIERFSSAIQNAAHDTAAFRPISVRDFLNEVCAKHDVKPA